LASFCTIRFNAAARPAEGAPPCSFEQPSSKNQTSWVRFVRFASTRRPGRDEGPHDDFEDQREDDQRRQENGEHLFGELPGLGLTTFAVQPLAEQRHESG